MAEKISKDAPTRKIDYQVDTLSYTPDAAAYFTFDRNSITLNHLENTPSVYKNYLENFPEKYKNYFKQNPDKLKSYIDKINAFNQSTTTIAHEEKHRDNQAKNLRNMPMSLEEYYKVCCHDEISATICELLQLRQEYINAKTPEEREKITKSPSANQFNYYFDAVKKGEINPFSNSPEGFEKEMKFIATKTQEMWLKDSAEDYNNNHTYLTKDFLNKHNLYELTPNPANYNKALKIAYTIGGIDFSKYMNDIPCINPSIELADKMVANQYNREYIESKIVEETNETSKSKDKTADFLDIPMELVALTLKNNSKLITPDIPYTGEPIYSEWSPEKRVSEVLTAEIYDFTQPFLKNQYEQMRIYDVEKKHKVSETLSEQKLNKQIERRKAQKELNQQENYQQNDATQTPYNNNLDPYILAKLNKGR